MSIKLIKEESRAFLMAIPVREDTLEMLTKAVEIHGYELDVHINSDIVFLVKRRTEGSIIIETFVLSRSDWLMINDLGHMQKMSNQFTRTTWDLGEDGTLS